MLTLVIPLRVFASNDGSLSLDANVLNNQTAGTSVGDFPIKGELFSPRINEIVFTQNKEQAQVTEKIKDITFEGTEEFGNQVDYKKLERQLFKDYTSSINNSSVEKRATQADFSFWVLLGSALPLILLSMFLAKKRAQRISRKKLR